MDAHVKLTISAIIVAFVGFLLMGVSNDSESGDKARNVAYFLMGTGLAAILILVAKDSPDQVIALGHTVVAFCGFGG